MKGAEKKAMPFQIKYIFIKKYFDYYLIMTTITINCLDKISLALDEKNYSVSFSYFRKI